MATAFQPRPFSSKLPDRSNNGQQQQQQQQYQHQQLQSQRPSTTLPTNNNNATSTAATAAERARLAHDGAAALAQLSDEQREEVAEAFALFDLDKDRRIDYHELKVALKALGFDLPKSEVLAILQTHGEPSAGPAAADAAPAPYVHSKLLLSQTAFTHDVALRILARDPREEVLRAFELFDADGKGKISVADLRRVARELGEGLQEEELVAMVEEFDLDGDGCIDREEFLGICLG